LTPRYVSTVDSGNLAGALMTLAEGLKQLSRDPQTGSELARRLAGLATRSGSFADGMRFQLLYDRDRGIFSIGYRLADAEGPGRLDPSYYDLLASEARLASFVAIAKGDLPDTHWFHLGRLVTSVEGTPTLLSWSSTLFEYLMPLLMMRSYPKTLLERSCLMAVRRHKKYAAGRGVPWGISESAYNLVDRHDNYQYKAFGVPGLGLKRGLGDELVVAPYATALAAMIDPIEAARNFRRLAAEGLEGKYGYYESIDYWNKKIDGQETAANGAVVRAYFAHHQGMTLVSLANALLSNVMVERFHADPRVQATELLLQERVPRHAPMTKPRPVEETRVSAPTPAAAVRRFRSPHTAVPHAQFLSNGNYTAVVTNSGGGASVCRGLAVTRHREDPTRDPGSQFLYLRDVWSGSLWSATYHPTGKEPEDYLVTLLAEKATFCRQDDDIATQLDIAVSTEDDVEVRRLSVTNKSDRHREIEVTSYAEIVLAPPADDLAHPAFGKLFVETEYVPESAALRRPPLPAATAIPGRSGRLGLARDEPGRSDTGADGVGVRSRAVPGPRAWSRGSAGPRWSLALGHDGGAPRSHRQLAAAHSPRAGWLRETHLRHRHRVLARDGRSPGAEVSRPQRDGADLRPGFRACAKRLAASGHLERGGHALRAVGVAGALCGRIAARESGAPGAERAGSARSLAA
jgi:cyclic beta-1,2-glucan synthetase